LAATSRTVERSTPQPPPSKDTPDILMLIAVGTPLLVALEAKMYDRPTREAPEAQMLRQGTVVLDYLQEPHRIRATCEVAPKAQ
jgi:hypothetical protein